MTKTPEVGQDICMRSLDMKKIGDEIIDLLHAKNTTVAETLDVLNCLMCTLATSHGIPEALVHAGIQMQFERMDKDKSKGKEDWV
jgi:hypothetical protein